MMELTEIELRLKGLDEGGKKYFKKDMTRPWSFKCSLCEKRVGSNKVDEYWSMPSTGYDRYRFCSKECADCYSKARKNELLAQRKQVMQNRKLLREFYKEAERRYMEVKRGGWVS